MTGPWRYGIMLACPHETEVLWGTAPTFDDANAICDDAPRRKDGWYRARYCPECRRRRRVSAAFMRFDAEHP